MYALPLRPALGLALLAFAFQQLPPSQPPLFRSGTRLVEVNVVVHDKHGQAVADLTKDDFNLLEAGKPQAISFFSVDRVNSAPAGAKPEPLPSHTFSNALALRENVPTNVTVI